MVNVSTLFYVLENLEDKDGELIDLNEIHELEQTFLPGLFQLIEKAILEVRPGLVESIILQSAGID